jgi:integrase
VKNGTEHVVPLPQLAVNLLPRVQRRAFSDLLFPGGISRSSGKPARISGWSKLIQPLRRAAAARGLVKTWTLHDLRRSARSAWPTLGVDERVCEALLNHTPADALLVAYDRRDFLAEKTQALEKWATAIENAIADPGEGAAVVRLAKKA